MPDLRMIMMIVRRAESVARTVTVPCRYTDIMIMIRLGRDEQREKKRFNLCFVMSADASLDLGASAVSPVRASDSESTNVMARCGRRRLSESGSPLSPTVTFFEDCKRPCCPGVLLCIVLRHHNEQRRESPWSWGPARAGDSGGNGCLQRSFRVGPTDGPGQTCIRKHKLKKDAERDGGVGGPVPAHWSGSELCRYSLILFQSDEMLRGLAGSNLAHYMARTARTVWMIFREP
jgi:hypothetical protein